MNINAKVIPNSRKQEIIKETENSYKIKLVSTPEKNKANKELIELLANYFNTRKSNIKIIKGIKSRNKIITIE